jgi:hypothetical protein
MSYNFRKDNRTDKKFAYDIKKAHQKEAIYAEAYRLQLDDSMPNYNVKLVPYGCGPDGEVIKGHINDIADALYIIGDHERLVEIKTAPEYLKKFFTFKVSSLKRCVKHEAHLLVCKHEEFWICSDIAKIQEMIDFLEHKIHYGFSPNDLSIRMDANLIEHYFNNSKWCETAQDQINQNKEVLM